MRSSALRLADRRAYIQSLSSFKALRDCPSPDLTFLANLEGAIMLAFHALCAVQYIYVTALVMICLRIYRVRVSRMVRSFSGKNYRLDYIAMLSFLAKKGIIKRL